MKFISFTKYKSYLESIGFSLEKKNDFSCIHLITYIFSKPGDNDKYFVNVFSNSDNVSSICYGYGTLYSGTIKLVKIDFRKNFWKNLI